MCGRYTLKVKGIELQHELGLLHEPVLEARYNIAPTQAAPIVLDIAPTELVMARWGFIPHWAKDLHRGSNLFNARSESISEKRAFREAFRTARCLVPCDGFYEWRHHGKQATPVHFRVPTHPVQTMAGLWSSWRSPEGLELVSYTLLTRAANEFMSRYHPRMPLFLPPETRAAWLAKDSPASRVEQLLHCVAPALSAIEVAAHVNRADVDDPRCLEPAAAVQLDLL